MDDILDLPCEILDFDESEPCQSHTITLSHQNSSFLAAIEHDHLSSDIYVNPALRYIASLDKKSSQQTNLYLLNSMARGMGFHSVEDCPWEKLNYDVVQKIIRELKDKELAPSYINLHLNALKQTILFAYKDDRIDHKTYLMISKIKSVRGSRVSKGRKISSDELKSLLQSCRGRTVIDLRDAAIILSMRAFGLRRSEVPELKTENLDLANQKVRILGKGNKERELGIPSQIVPVLKNWVNVLEKQSWKSTAPTYLFPPLHKSGRILNKKMSSGSIKFILAKRIGLAQVDKFSPHDMRRTFCTSLLEGKTEMSDVQKLMGHSDIRTTQGYDLRDKGRLLEISKQMTVF